MKKKQKVKNRAMIKECKQRKTNVNTSSQTCRPRKRNEKENQSLHNRVGEKKKCEQKIL